MDMLMLQNAHLPQPKDNPLKSTISQSDQFKSSLVTTAVKLASKMKETVTFVPPTE
jgi:hypothetical protein